MIPNLKSKLKAMSSNFPLHSSSTGNTDSVADEQLAEKDNIESNPDRFIPVYAPVHNNNKVQGKSKNRDNKVEAGDLGGQIILGTHGSFIKKSTIYDKNIVYGKIEITDLCTLNLNSIKWWSRLNNNFTIKDVVFLDTETTGLAGGTGTYPFLIGLGYITDEGFVIEQYLMRDFDEEYPMLSSVLDVLKNFKLLVTFNGKSFDWPLLESRLVYSRIKPIYWEESHLDLLHVARRLWGKLLDSCSLISIENNILDRQRGDDIPGYLIPKIYFDYLETRNTEALKQVVKHNEWDIASLAALLLHVSRLYDNPTGNANPYELLSIAKELERNHRILEASDCYKCCINTAEIHSLRIDAKKRYAYLKKRYEGPNEAMNIWEDLAQEDGNMLIFPLIEMAKYLEHGKKDYKKALEYTEKAIHLTNKLHGYGELRHNSLKLKEELLVRKRRLVKKIERSMELWG